MNLNDDERKVLDSLVDALSGDDFGYLSFYAIGVPWGMNRRIVRRACRSLTRKGLAEFKAGLWTEDGEPAGSGYAATRAGAEFIKQLQAA